MEAFSREPRGWAGTSQPRDRSLKADGPRTRMEISPAGWPGRAACWPGRTGARSQDADNKLSSPGCRTGQEHPGLLGCGGRGPVCAQQDVAHLRGLGENPQPEPVKRPARYHGCENRIIECPGEAGKQSLNFVHGTEYFCVWLSVVSNPCETAAQELRGRGMRRDSEQ